MAPSNGSNAATGGFLGALARFWTHSYAPDYVGFAALLTAYILIVLLVEPFHRLFSISDLAIAFPHAEVERVPVAMNVIYAAFVPLAAVVLVNLSTRASFHKHHTTVLGLAIAIILTSFLTDVVKNTVGRPRPDLLARCKPKPGTPKNTLVDFTVCTETDSHTLHDGWRSFPSGHSSFSFAGLGYTALFLAGQLRIFRDRRDLGRALICLTPIAGAAMIAMSRCQDYRHDVYDVCTGSLLGITIAIWSYRRYWPRLSSRECDVPYPVPGSIEEREREESRGGWSRVRDEEEGPVLGRNGAYEMAELGQSRR
ncbi:PAP2 superfamily protein [Apiospora phragmitis]|uniref:PAP2 superfamily protein n=1 Tax=Apiospora phragmitis TaxID=2905665 RepID=A0ABR1VGC8_9PEZI